MAYDISKLVTLGQLKSLATKVHSEDNAIIGTSGDASTDITVYGARALADSKVGSVSAGSNGAIAIGGTATAPTVSLLLSPKADNDLEILTTSGDEGLYYKAAAAVVYSMARKSTPNTGYAATYQLTADGVATGDDINIPKDMVVESGSVVDITYNSGDGKLYDGATDVTELIKGAGGTATAADAGKYIKLIIANADEDTLYIKATDLVDVYTAGNGIDITANVISVVIDSTNANGLSVGNDGVALAQSHVAGDTYTIISTADQKAAAGTTYYKKVGDAYIECTGLTAGTSVVTGLYTKTDGSNAVTGAMTGAQATTLANLAGIKVANDEEVTEMIAEVFA